MDTNHPSGSNANPGRPERGVAPSGQPANSARRRLFRGAAAGTGVLLAVQAKSALGQAVCQSPSAMVSGNLSRPANADGTCSGGLSPGYWAQPQHFEAWRAAGQIPPEINGQVIECSLSGLGKLTMTDITQHGTTVQSVFGFTPTLKATKTSPSTPVNPCSLWAVLAFHGDFENGIFLFHLAAAWLNANYFLGASATYPMTPTEVQEMFADTVTGGTFRGYPGWDANFVVNYISSLYDQNSPVPNFCVEKSPKS